ncbi:MAG: radical SAM protein [Alphaproteobacteria bacterium]|nr:radical SAM protein [Alphaproteobacteria bacterium]
MLFVNRRTGLAAVLPLEAVDCLRSLRKAPPPYPPIWFRDVLAITGEDTFFEDGWHDGFVMRRSPRLGFERAAWEITERCNFRCPHCYLDEKTQSGPDMESRLRILGQLEDAGCLWLQLTGGEVLADPLFGETYRAAWKRGFLLTISTNGQFIKRWIELFGEMPPHRLTVSLYGASSATYVAATKNGCAFKDVIDGLDSARQAGIAVRVSIMVTTANAHEVDEMERMMRARGVDYHTYSKLSPTLRGRTFPLEIEADIKRVPAFFHERGGCAGGTKSLHIYVSGRASPCRLLPNISVDLLTEDISTLSRMELHPGTRPTKPECAHCPSAAQCTTCAPVYALHKKARSTRGRVCRW